MFKSPFFLLLFLLAYHKQKGRIENSTVFFCFLMQFLLWRTAAAVVCNGEWGEAVGGGGGARGERGMQWKHASAIKGVAGCKPERGGSRRRSWGSEEKLGGGAQTTASIQRPPVSSEDKQKSTDRACRQTRAQAVQDLTGLVDAIPRWADCTSGGSTSAACSRLLCHSVEGQLTPDGRQNAATAELKKNFHMTQLSSPPSITLA